ncbi:hypothetical protein TCAL_00929 [Tigriopus californicus]|uniref:BHLH domain-containing protein n=1 Tax=Tigriopus californicus TaxID=6832 RepID=A0A553P7T9_TIGCA|nr:helix-loop-helix protein 11-like [Tigriopus californicus]TRY73739.1 hypothetical protein TCAL_00929 [Tigriopus californicus]|eukprot:TCALIF_00929-PA protein Name:"Similar to TFAP4 Transcription factor AP-4 (Homo sapiens)" AED:0.02 eAED:0.02 QI:239/1/1/1/1/1/6/136/351
MMMDEDMDLPVDQERKIRREIANSNERRRMQSINAGFQSLRTLLPHHEGEKLSKAAILQQTAEYIYTLEQEKTRLLAQNCQLKRLLSLNQHHSEAEGSAPTTQPKRQKKMTATKTIPASATTSVTTSTTSTVAVSTTSTKLSEEPDQTLLTPSAKIVVPHAEAQEVVVTTTLPTPTATAPLPPTKDSIELNSENCRIILASEPAQVVAVKSERAPVEARVPPVTSTVSAGAPVPTTIMATVSHPSDQGAESQPGDVVVEVGTIETPGVGAVTTISSQPELSPSGRSYIVTSASKQNLDSIVEAIKHLEGDELFEEGQPIPQRNAVEFHTLSDLNGQSTSNQSIIILKNCNN